MPRKTLPTFCKTNGCNRDAVCKGLCMRCYGRMRRPPKTNTTRNRPSLLAEHADEWRVLNAIRERCTNPKSPSYCNYGAKGVRICDRWMGRNGLKHFIEDMGPRPKGYTNGGRPLFSVDRIDASKGYCKENCRWATIWEQNTNTSRNKKHIGVYLLKCGRWRAEITVSGKTYQKEFKTESEAIKYREYLEKEYL